MSQADYWSKKPVRFTGQNSFAETCMPYLTGSTGLLDLGCGRGKDSLYFAKQGCLVTALDIAASNLAILREAAEKGGVESIRSIEHDLSKPLPFSTKNFDAVYAHLSLHYFDDANTKEIFSEVHRVLKPGGWFFVKCKSIDDPLYGKGEKVGADMYCEGHVRHFFSENYMRECLEHFEIMHLAKTASVYVDYESAFIEAVTRKSS